MTGAEVPPPSAPESPPARTPRRTTFVGRLADALREQNWAAVGIELGIVVLGVLIAFQVTAWGEARADRSKEEVYLRQLAADLVETERILGWADSVNALSARAADHLAGAFYDPDLPPRDSLLVWIGKATNLVTVDPITGTAHALVETGDLGLIRDDSLRSAITAYLGQIEGMREVRAHLHVDWMTGLNVLSEGADPYEARASYVSREDLDSLSHRLIGKPFDEMVVRSPLRADAFLGDPRMRKAARDMSDRRGILNDMYDRLRTFNSRLLERVEAALRT